MSTHVRSSILQYYTHYRIKFLQFKTLVTVKLKHDLQVSFK